MRTPFEEAFRDATRRVWSARWLLTLPAATVTDGSGSALNPGVRRLPAAATHLCLRAATACKGSLEYWG